jgi:hypothetical protein
VANSYEESQASTGSAELPFNLQRIWLSSFYQALQLVRCFDSDPGNPTAAAVLSLLFQRLQVGDSLKKLHLWLYNYVSPYVDNEPRNQTDQIEKTLAVASYLYISDHISFGTRRIRRQRLTNYIEYASTQQWFADSFLAFYCSLLEDIGACGDVSRYFGNNLERFLARKHIPALCQALLVLGDNQLSKTNRQRSIETVCDSLTSPSVSLNHAAWGLMALSHHGLVKNYQSTIEQLAELVDSHLMEHILRLIRESKWPSLLALRWSGAEQADTQRHPRAFSKHGDKPLTKVELNSNGNIRLSPDVQESSDELTWGSTPQLSLTDIGLALAALHAADRYSLVGVTLAEESRLVSFLQKAQRLSQEGSIVLSRPENIVASLLAIATTAILGVALWLYFVGARFSFNLDLSKASWRDIDVWLAMVAWSDYMLAQIQALCSGDSAISGMLKIPLLRHFAGAQQAWRKASSRRHRE